jgi:hypothetical protein
VCGRQGGRAAGQLPQTSASPAQPPRPLCPNQMPACLPACPCVQAKEQLLAERDAELACTQERVEALEKDVGMKARMLAGISQVGAGQAGGLVGWVGGRAMGGWAAGRWVAGWRWQQLIVHEAVSQALHNTYCCLLLPCPAAAGGGARRGRGARCPRRCSGGHAAGRARRGQGQGGCWGSSPRRCPGGGPRWACQEGVNQGGWGRHLLLAVPFSLCAPHGCCGAGLILTSCHGPACCLVLLLP